MLSKRQFSGVGLLRKARETAATETVHRFRVEYANGDDFDAPRQFSDIEVSGENERDARLAAEQMAYTPHLGKPEHIQLTGTRRINE